MSRKNFLIMESKKVFLEMFPVCQICGKKKAEEMHHLFPQTKQNRRLYPDYIDRFENILAVCPDCHGNRAHHIDELSFCLLFRIQPKSKSALWKVKNDGIEML